MGQSIAINLAINLEESRKRSRNWKDNVEDEDLKRITGEIRPVKNQFEREPQR